MARIPVRVIAIYLPQFHPIPENDEWWGRGFTEWTNVVKARPLFWGHYQPHLPADLGFYDLRLSEARAAQAALAEQYGIHGFCYYHYWFHGKRLLERPFAEVLASGKPDFPFCLCWANENWTRRWDGLNKQVLVQQHYSKEDDLSHIRWLLNAFGDKRYIRIEGKPLFLVYRPQELPEALRTTDLWREEAHRAGLGELFLCAIENTFSSPCQPPQSIGFDAALDFQPNLSAVIKTAEFRLMQMKSKLDPRRNTVLEYSDFVRLTQARPPVTYRRFTCVTPAWDNSPRRRNSAFILHRAKPAIYEQWLRCALSNVVNTEGQDNLLFINAWNEWAEGAHLEPCQRWGLAYLEATRRVLAG